MKHERHVKYDGKKVEFLEPVNVWMLEKIQSAIEIAKEDNEALVPFSFGELQTIRRLLIMQDIERELCRDNILEGMEVRDYKRAKKEEAESKTTQNHLGKEADDAGSSEQESLQA